MKKTILYISISLALFTATVVMPHVMAAQGDAGVGATLTAESGCTWMGAPFDSELRVEDDSVCVITGSHPLGGATYTRGVTIEGDLNGNGVGGILIVGSTTVDTEFGIEATSGLAIVNNGTIIIGQGTTHGYASKIVTAADNDVQIYGENTASTFKASLETTSNTTTNAHNLIQVGGSLTVGISTNETGVLTLNDNAISTVAKDINVYDELNISSATLSATGLVSQITIGPQATADANVTITSGTLQTTSGVNGRINVYYDSVVTNGGNMYSDHIYVGDCSGGYCGTTNIQGGKVTNSGTMRSYSTSGRIQLYDGAINNTGTIQVNAGSYTFFEIFDDDLTTDPDHNGILTNSGTGIIFGSRFYIGDQSLARPGGQLILNDSSKYNSSSSTQASIIYTGRLENNNVTTTQSISMGGSITVWGTATKSSSILSKGHVVNVRGVSLNEYSTMELETSTSKWIVGSMLTMNVLSDTAGTNKAELTIGTGSILSAVAGVNCGQSGDTSRGGIVTNNGTIRALDYNGNPINSAQRVNLYGTSTFENNGTILLYSGVFGTWHTSTFTNNIGASITKGTATTQTTAIYDSGIFNNYGSINGYDLRVGYQTITGGTFNNYGTLNLNNLLQVHHGGVFDNKTDGIINDTLTSALAVGYTSGNIAYFYQRERTANSNTKANFSTATVSTYGEVHSWDTMAISSTLTINSGGKFYQKTANNSATTVAGTTDVSGFLESELNSNFIGTSAITVTSTGSLTNNGKVTGSATTTNPITVSGGKIVSSNASEFALASSSYDGIYGTTANTTEIEIAGIVTTNNNIKIDAGTLCFGDYTSPACGSSGVTQTMGNLTGNAIDDAINTNIFVGNNITFSYIYLLSYDDTRTTTFTNISTSNIVVTGDVEVYADNTLMILNGDFDQSTGIFKIGQNAKVKLLHPTASYTFGSLLMTNLYLSDWGNPADAALLQVGDATTASGLNIVDYHTCAFSAENCAIELNNAELELEGEFFSTSRESRIDIYGTLTVTTSGAAEKMIYAGKESFSGIQEFARGYINVIANSNVAGSLVDQTAGGLVVGYNGRVDVGYHDSSKVGSVDLSGYAMIRGKDLGTNANRGLNVNGTFDCYGYFYVGTSVAPDAQVDVGHTGVITVNGSESYIVGFMELDGTFNAGDLYVDYGGWISSGGIDSEQTETNFLINATLLDIGFVDSSSKISSDGVSSLTNSLSVPGSYGGDGAGRTGTTYGAAKFTDMTASTAVPYGEDGNLTGVVTAKGGGAVRINVTGDILNNGIISANGAEAGALSNGHGGAGGTVLINHNITHSDTNVTFLGNGTISADGRAGNGTGLSGGGGRIIIDSIIFDKPDDGTGSEYGFLGAIHADGGSNAASGTIVFLGDDNNPNGSLYVEQYNSATSGSKTYIPNTGTAADFTFDRVEGFQYAVVEYQAAPTTLPVSCYETGIGSSVTIPGGYSCANNSFPDKPYKMYINNSWIGAQIETEPSGPNPLDVYDSTPAFSIVYKQPITANDPVNYVEIQVAGGPDFTTLLWDATGTNRIALNTALNADTRSEDIIYEGDPLNVNTPYYVRMRFVDTINSVTRGGLWNHRDMGNQYKFNIPDYVIVSNDCTDSMEITDTNAAGRPIGSSLYNAPGDRYGFDSCTISVTATPVAWLLKYSKAVGITGFFDTGEINQLAEIDNAGGDCAMDVAGNTASEKYAYNIYTTDAQLTGKVQTNATCLGASYACATYPCNNSDKYFNVENSGTADTILSTSSGAVVAAEFLLNLHLNVGNSTVPEAYSLGTRMLILSPP